MFQLKRAFCLVIVVCLSTFSWSATSSCKFKRGDSNGDGSVNVADPQHLLNYAYSGGPAPPNLDAADANDDGLITGADANYITAYLYQGGSPPPDPGPTTASCDPTTWDGLEPSCTPVGNLSVISAAVAPSTAPFGPAWDCNQSFVWAGNPRKINISALNSEETEAANCVGAPTDQLTNTPCCKRNHGPCWHPDTTTRWTFIWDIFSYPTVERLAFNTGCTRLHVKLDWRAGFRTGGPCTLDGGACPTGNDYFLWVPTYEDVKFTFRNQTTNELSPQFKLWDGSSYAAWAYSYGIAGNPTCQGLSFQGINPIQNRNIYLTGVTWSGNDQWKLESVEVNFEAQLFTSGDDNSDMEEIKEYSTDWSIHLETLRYLNL